MAIGAAGAGVGGSAVTSTGGGSIGASDGVIDGAGDGVQVGVSVGWRVACGVNSAAMFFTGALGAGTLSGWGKIQLLTATRTGAGRRCKTRA